jgi:hypothetical protein
MQMVNCVSGLNFRDLQLLKVDRIWFLTGSHQLR